MTGMIGAPVTRLEDPELLVGAGTFIDNLRLDGLLHTAFVRSPVAHALLSSVDTADAAAMPGVAAVLTGADLAEMGLRPHHHFAVIDDVFARPPLAVERVRFVGEAVALVVADTKAHAQDAAEAVQADYEPLPPVVDFEAALEPGATVLFPAHGSNVAISIMDRELPDLFADADVVARGRFENQRLAAVPMEPNAFAAVPQPDGRLLVYAATQMPHALKGALAAALNLDPEQVRVVAPHMGGGFGAKVGLYCEHTAVAAAARRLGRPVVWVETRSEDMVALTHSRAQVQYAELGLTREGKMVGLRVQLVADAGAYPGIGGMLVQSTRRMSQGVYDIPAVQVDLAAAATTTTPIGAYRGAGRPEAAAMIERLVDLGAAEIGMDPVELRRRNFIAPDRFPFETHTGGLYDSGDYDKPLREALRLAGYDALRAEQRERRARGDSRLLGIGVATYVEITAGGSSTDFAGVEIGEDGDATITVGTSAHGQGHHTTYAQIVSDRLGIALERIRLVQSDTDAVPRGGGTGGSRSLQIGGTAVLRAAETVLDAARRLAAELLEASPDDIVVQAEGGLGVAGVPARALEWSALAKEANARGLAAGGNAAGEVNKTGLAAFLDSDQGAATYPFGAHVAVVELDSETGRVELVRHIGVDDAGTVVNPLLLAGQQHGGLASGIAQALFEEMRYDAEGNPRTATLVDYLIPSAAELPSFEAHSTETPTPLNPLGAKGIGEAATIGATPAVQNAVVDALAHLGVRHIDLPCSPERVWRTIEDAKAGRLADPWRPAPALFASLERPDAEAAVSAGPDAPDV